ncbi:MAG TPA: hypothetical protein VN616_06235 [Puia sp.]|nr:hypothetical protein [Puia sp.]
MAGSGHIDKRAVWKAFVLLVGLSLFAEQVSYKFYRSASMPLIASHFGRHVAEHCGPARDKEGAARLSLDKRFDLTCCAILTPLIRLLPGCRPFQTGGLCAFAANPSRPAGVRALPILTDRLKHAYWFTFHLIYYEFRI